MYGWSGVGGSVRVKPVQAGQTQFGWQEQKKSVDTSALIPAFSPRRRGIFVSPKRPQALQLVRTSHDSEGGIF